jgi:hypothetical protein
LHYFNKKTTKITYKNVWVRIEVKNLAIINNGQNYTKSQAENTIHSPLTTHNCLPFTTTIISTYMNTILTYVMPHFSPLLFMLEVESSTLGTIASE